MATEPHDVMIVHVGLREQDTNVDACRPLHYGAHMRTPPHTKQSWSFLISAQRHECKKVRVKNDTTHLSAVV